MTTPSVPTHSRPIVFIRSATMFATLIVSILTSASLRAADFVPTPIAPQTTNSAAEISQRIAYYLYRIVNSAGAATNLLGVGARDVIATNTVTISSLTAPTAGYVVATNATPFFSVAGGRGMLQQVMLCAHSNAPLKLHIFRAYPGVATPGSAFDYDILNKGHLRLCPPLDFSTWTGLGTGGASGESFCSAVYGLNIPVASVDTCLYWILVAGDSPKAQAGWGGTGTAPIHLIFSGVEDPVPQGSSP